MTIKLENTTIIGYITNASPYSDTADNYKLHVRMLKSSSFMDGYDSPVSEGFATWGEAEQMLLKKCYEVADNHLSMKDIPF